MYQLRPARPKVNSKGEGMSIRGTYVLVEQRSAIAGVCPLLSNNISTPTTFLKHNSPFYSPPERHYTSTILNSGSREKKRGVGNQGKYNITNDKELVD